MRGDERFLKLSGIDCPGHFTSLLPSRVEGRFWLKQCLEGFFSDGKLWDMIGLKASSELDSSFFFMFCFSSSSMFVFGFLFEPPVLALEGALLFCGVVGGVVWDNPCFLAFWRNIFMRDAMAVAGTLGPWSNVSSYVEREVNKDGRR